MIDDDGIPTAYEEASVTAQAVKQWWHERGFADVQAWPLQRPIKYHEKTVGYSWGVASNLCGGIPPGASPRDVARLYAGLPPRMEAGR